MNPEGTRYDQCFRLFDLATGAYRTDLRTTFGHTHPTHIAFSPDGTVIAGNFGPVLGVVSVADGKQVARIKVGTKHITALAFTPDGSKCVTVSNDTKVRRVRYACFGRKRLVMNGRLGHCGASRWPRTAFAWPPGAVAVRSSSGTWTGELNQPSWLRLEVNTQPEEACGEREEEQLARREGSLAKRERVQCDRLHKDIVTPSRRA